jgi:molecular chaperone GrpE
MNTEPLNPEIMAAEVNPTTAPVAEAPLPPEALAEAVKIWQDKALRAAADLENYRKRAAVEVADAKAYALMSFARDLLPVADNLTRALEAPAGTEQALRDGVKMVADQLAGVFGRHGIAPVAATPGMALNPDHHQPMLETPSDHPPGHVVSEMQAGYTLNGRLIRPAFVSVSAVKN